MLIFRSYFHVSKLVWCAEKIKPPKLINAKSHLKHTFRRREIKDHSVVKVKRIVDLRKNTSKKSDTSQPSAKKQVSALMPSYGRTKRGKKYRKNERTESGKDFRVQCEAKKRLRILPISSRAGDRESESNCEDGCSVSGGKPSAFSSVCLASARSLILHLITSNRASVNVASAAAEILRFFGKRQLRGPSSPLRPAAGSRSRRD